MTYELRYPALTKTPLTKNELFTATEVRARYKAMIAAAKVLEQAALALGEAVEDSTLSCEDCTMQQLSEVHEMMADHAAARSATDFIIHGRIS